MSVNEKMTAIADAIRTKTDGTGKLTLDDMPSEIDRACWDYFYYGEEMGYQDGHEDGHEKGKTEGIEEGYNTATEEINTELLEVIELQESYIYPTVFFYFKGEEYHIRESEAYWTDKISFEDKWQPGEPSFIWNDNGYAKWEYYLITDSQNNYVKYNDAIKNLEQYSSTTQFRFFIQCDDGNKYTIEFDTFGETSTELSYSSNAISGFEMIMDENFNPTGYYFTPKNSEKKYYISQGYNYIELEYTVYATLVEGGNE